MVPSCACLSREVRGKGGCVCQGVPWAYAGGESADLPCINTSILSGQWLAGNRARALVGAEQQGRVGEKLQAQEGWLLLILTTSDRLQRSYNKLIISQFFLMWRCIVLSQQLSGAAMVRRLSAYIHPRLVWSQVCGSCSRHRWEVWCTGQAGVFRKKLN